MVYRFKITSLFLITLSGPLLSMQQGRDVKLIFKNAFAGEIKLRVQTPGRDNYLSVPQHHSVDVGYLSDVQKVIVNNDKSRLEIMGSGGDGLLNCWNRKAKKHAGQSTMEVVISRWSNRYPNNLTWSCGASFDQALATSKLQLKNNSNEPVWLMLQNPTNPQQKPDPIIINPNHAIMFNISAWAISRLIKPILYWNNNDVLKQVSILLREKDEHSLADKSVTLEFSRNQSGKRVLTTIIEGFSLPEQFDKD